MGGYGSTRWGWYSKKYTVEDSLKLDIHRLYELLPRDSWTNSSWLFFPITWSRGDRKVASIGLWLDAYGDVPRVILDYQATPYGGGQPQSIHTVVELSSTPCRYGSVRWWFRCPGCGKRVGCLYKAPGSYYFRCRHCHDLTYTSAQEAHEFEASMRAHGIDTKPLAEIYPTDEGG